jgi:hypothetical protein
VVEQLTSSVLGLGVHLLVFFELDGVTLPIVCGLEIFLFESVLRAL